LLIFRQDRPRLDVAPSCGGSHKPCSMTLL
jgi:hypothetical protein